MGICKYVFEHPDSFPPPNNYTNLEKGGFTFRPKKCIRIDRENIFTDGFFTQVAITVYKKSCFHERYVRFRYWDKFLGKYVSCRFFHDEDHEKYHGRIVHDGNWQFHATLYFRRELNTLRCYLCNYFSEYRNHVFE